MAWIWADMFDFIEVYWNVWEINIELGTNNCIDSQYPMVIEFISFWIYFELILCQN